MSEELQSRYIVKNKIVGQKFGEYEYFEIGSTTFCQLKKAHLIPATYSKDFNAHKPDRLLIDRRDSKNSKVVCVIEDKTNGKFNNPKDEISAIQQCNNYCQELGCALGVITDGSKTIWINSSEFSEENAYKDDVTEKLRSFTLIKDEEGRAIKKSFILDKKDFDHIDEATDTNKELYTFTNKIIGSIDESNSQFREWEAIDPIELATRVWQDIWVATGKTPEKCLYNVVELFIFKFLSDLKILNENFDELHRRIERGDSSKEVLTYYVNSCRDEILKKFDRGVDQTTIINGTIFVNESGKPNLSQASLFVNTIKKFKAFENKNGKFSNKNIDKKFKTELYEKFLKQTSGLKTLGQYFTPRKVVHSVVRMAENDIKNLGKDDILCDPFCGVGGFVLEPINLVRRKDFEPKNGKLNPPVKYMGFDKGFEKDEERTIILAKANMLIYLADTINKGNLPTKEMARVFNETFRLLQTNLGTLGQIEYRDKIKLILTNPPYVTSGSGALKDEISENSELKDFYSVNAVGVEGLALEWIIRSLEKEGKAYVIIPDGILNRLSDSKLRRFILEQCYIDAIVSLPVKTFFTTPKKTYIIVLQKKADIQDEQKHPVFTYLASDIGETLDVNRFEIKENDLIEMVTMFKQFNSIKNDVEAQSILEKQSSRCKIQQIEKFVPETHWSVDRWWTREEKIELGIEEEEKEVTVDQFINLVDLTAKELQDLSKASKDILKKNSKTQGVNFSHISLADKEYFTCAIGKRLLRKDLFKNRTNTKAKIPAFSANVFSPFGFVEKSNIENFKNPYILWGIDGNFDFKVVHKGEVFASTDHCGTIEVLDKDINPEYLLYMLYSKKHVYGFDRGLRSNLVNVKKMEIGIPVDDSGKFDYPEQELLVVQLRELYAIQTKIDLLEKQIDEVTVLISKDYQTENVPILKIFDPLRGNSKYTKKFANENAGTHPVYSASNDQPLGFIDSYDFEGKYLTWATNGFGGYTKMIDGKFSVNADRGILVPLVKDVDIDYVRFVIQPILRKLAKGRIGNKGKNEFTKVNLDMMKTVEIPIPVDDKGDFDIVAQGLISDKYKNVEDLKNQLKEKLKNLSQVKFTFE